MNLTVIQTISIHQLRVDSVTNSSILQVGCSGMIKALSNLYNTGGFTEPAPPAAGGLPTHVGTSEVSFVPLPALR